MKKMTFVTNRYTLGLIIAALFSVMVYVGYMGLNSHNEIVMNEAIVVDAVIDQEQEEELFLSNSNLADSNAVFFVEYRFDRDRTRGKQLELLRNIIDDPNSVVDTRQEAEQKIIQITGYLEQELQLENLIKAKGFEDAVVFLQPGSVTAVINQGEFTRNEIVQITDLATTVTGQGIENIFIVPKGREIE